MSTIRLTMAQALVRFLAAQGTLCEGREVPLFAGVWAIFGHGNVAGIGEALYRHRAALPTYRAHNEQAMAHAAIAFAKATFRRRMMACTTSIGPGATNLITAAATAHVEREHAACARKPRREIFEVARVPRQAMKTQDGHTGECRAGVVPVVQLQTVTAHERSLGVRTLHLAHARILP